MMFKYTFSSTISLFPGPSDWYFIDLPKDISDEIKDVTSMNRRGFGAVRVDVELGKSKWQTSIFPHSKNGVYMLPLKRQIRQENNLDYDDAVEVELVLSDFQ